ncbi:hypothetical protein [Sphaerothrix gracilis]|uniref:hypothetical protein n=1 Tax=Sphaerothrix gracilis TaxID=3151835 RepID=UPI0031FE3473
MSELTPPFLDLFQQLRQAGLALTLEQYDLLQQALNQGFGLKSWSDLRRVCKLLWLKPDPIFDADRFDQLFDRYVQQRRQQLQPPDRPVPRQPAPEKSFQSRLPQVPPRRTVSQDAASEIQAPVAAKTRPPAVQPSKQQTHFQLTPVDLPLPLMAIAPLWKRLQQRQLEDSSAYELDLEATVDQISRVGFFSEVVLRPTRVRRANLLLLVDDSEAMRPFRPALQPLLTALQEGRIGPGQIYRFTGYPDNYLYDGQFPSQATALSTVLSRLHRASTVMIVVSEVGAATGTYRAPLVQGITRFLTRVFPCVHDLLWLNPLPRHRWAHTSAQLIDKILTGRMVPLAQSSLQMAIQARSPAKMPLWSLPPSLRNR